jgi:hypothetical protein
MNKKIIIVISVLIFILISVFSYFILLNYKNSTWQELPVDIWQDIRGKTWNEMIASSVKKVSYTNKLEDEKAIITYFSISTKQDLLKKHVIDAINLVGTKRDCTPSFKVVYCFYLLNKIDRKKIVVDPILLSELLKFQKMDEENSLAYYLLGYYHQLLGKESEAIKFYDQAISQKKFNLYQNEWQKMQIEYLSQFSKDELFTKNFVFNTTPNHVLMQISAFRLEGMNKITQKEFNADSFNTDFGRKLIKSSTDMVLVFQGEGFLLKSDPEKNSTKSFSSSSNYIYTLFIKEKDKKMLIKFMNDRLNLGEFETYKKWYDAYLKTGGFPE